MAGHRFAIRMATGDLWDANDVGPQERDGPWKCPTCPLRFKTHRIMSTRVDTHGGPPIPVSAAFVLKRGDMHKSQSCSGSRKPRELGQTDDGSRAHIRKALGLPGPNPISHAPTTQNDGRPRTEYEYGPDVHGLAGLLDFARECERVPALAVSEKVRIVGGNDYWWHELWYGPTRDAYRRANTLIMEQFRWDSRAYFVEGFARDVPAVGKAGRWITLRLNTDFTPEREEIRVYLPNSPVNWAAVCRIAWKTPVAVFAHKIAHVHGHPSLELADHRQLIAGSSAHMITTPRL